MDLDGYSSNLKKGLHLSRFPFYTVRQALTQLSPADCPALWRWTLRLRRAFALESAIAQVRYGRAIWETEYGRPHYAFNNISSSVPPSGLAGRLSRGLLPTVKVARQGPCPCARAWAGRSGHVPCVTIPHEYTS